MGGSVPIRTDMRKGNIFKSCWPSCLFLMVILLILVLLAGWTFKHQIEVYSSNLFKSNDISSSQDVHNSILNELNVNDPQRKQNKYDQNKVVEAEKTVRETLEVQKGAVPDSDIHPKHNPMPNKSGKRSKNDEKTHSKLITFETKRQM